MKLPRRIHVLGMGNVGVFVAHSLASIPNPPPLTLLLKGQEQFWRWKDAKDTLKLTTHGITETRKGFDVEIQQRQQLDDGLKAEKINVDSPINATTQDIRDSQASSPERTDWSRNTSPVHNLSSEGYPLSVRQGNAQPGNDLLSQHDFSDVGDLRQGHCYRREAKARSRPAEVRSIDQDVQPTEHQQLHDGYDNGSTEEQKEIIYHLIVATKAPRAAKALQSWAHRLGPESTILFLQNGMGVIDEVNEQVFPNPELRPQYMLGVNSHGLMSRGVFDIVHVGEGTIALGIMPQLANPGSEPLQSLSQAPASSHYLLRTMTRTPVFVAVGFSPTDLLLQQLDKLAINAIINPLTAVLDCKNGGIIYSFNITRIMRLLLAEIALVLRSLPELQSVPNINMRFNTVRLERLVTSIAEITSNNDSSMLQDTRTGRQTEIDYINGYIIRRGEELGLHCVMNYMLTHMVKAKGTLISRRDKDILPFPGTIKKIKT